jgi:hypothetical protein
MRIDEAKEVRDLCLQAIEGLTKALDKALVVSDAETLERLRKGVGISIGTIDTRLLAVLYELHPELDHLREK